MGFLNINERQLKKLLKDWGYMPLRPGANHQLFKHEDHTLPVAHDWGNKPSDNPAKAAAAHLGITLARFLEGPPRAPKADLRKDPVAARNRLILFLHSHGGVIEDSFGRTSTILQQNTGLDHNQLRALEKDKLFTRDNLGNTQRYYKVELNYDHPQVQRAVGKGPDKAVAETLATAIDTPPAPEPPAPQGLTAEAVAAQLLDKVVGLIDLYGTPAAIEKNEQKLVRLQQTNDKLSETLAQATEYGQRLRRELLDAKAAQERLREENEDLKRRVQQQRSDGSPKTSIGSVISAARR